MEYSLTFNDIGLYGSVCGLNPYSNGILPDAGDHPRDVAGSS